MPWLETKRTGFRGTATAPARRPASLHVGLDHEGYSPDFFSQMKQRRIARLC
jgi:hypothetical protein